ncbi:uncharacterized protein METZ01_LOCUS258289, partial [marine metagenome]
MKFNRLLPVFCNLFSAVLVWSAEPVPLPESTPWDVEALSRAPAYEWVAKEGKVKSLTYRGLPYKGKATS